MNTEEKIRVAIQLEKLGVNIIEAGFPASNKKDFEAIKQIASVIENSEVCALARCTKNDIDIAWEAVKNAKNPRIHVFLATSDIHLKDKLKITREEAIKKINEGVTYAKARCQNIEFSAEDSTRTNIDFLKIALSEAVKAGATTINIPDSVGYAQPVEYGKLIAEFSSNPEFIKKEICISVHCHDDLGSATANSLEGVLNGATQVECTINGIGERAGNAALEEIIMALHTRPDYYGAKTQIETKELLNSSKMVSEVTGIFVQKNKAIVGSNAFAHEAGIHQHGMIANPKCYEVIDASAVGRETQLVLGRHSGKHAIIEFMKKQKIPIEENFVIAAIEAVKNSEKEEDIKQAIISACRKISTYAKCSNVGGMLNVRA
jgi:2-isopropylmalate synthase